MAATDPRLRVASPDAAGDRLIDAAERLVAIRQGVGVSDRAIITEAGQHNNSAITYHFGNRQGLMEAVWHRRLRRVSGRREELIEEFQQPLASLDVRSAVTLYVRPLCDEIDSLDPSYWARFNERILQDLPLNFIPWVRTDAAKFDGSASTDRLLALFERLRVLVIEMGIAAPTAEIRVAMASRFVVGCLAGWERSVALAEDATPELAALRDDLISMTVALLEAKTDVRS